MVELIQFYGAAAVAIGACLLVIGQRNPMHSVLWLIAAFGALASLYIQLDSPFAAVTQIIVYAGAIMVLFLFVVMLLNAPREDVPTAYGPSAVTLTSGPRKVFALLSVILLVQLAWVLATVGRQMLDTSPAVVAPVQSVRAIGQRLFTDFAFAFEVTSVLILVAMVGAVILARKRA